MMTRYRDCSLAELVETARSPRRFEHEAAFDEIVRRFRAHALASAFGLLRDPHLAQDVAQEAFLDAYNGLEKLRDPAAFPGWFRRIVFKHADRIRRRPRVAHEQLSSAEGEAHDGESPEAHLTVRENITRVREALSELPQHERDVVVLFYFGHQSHVEIGERLELPVSTVKKRLHDARRRLRVPLEAPETRRDLGAPPSSVSVQDAPLRGRHALRLATLSTREARGALARFEPDQVALALQELPPAERVAFLEVSERLPEIVPCLPEVTLTQTIRMVGMDEAGWLVEFASPEQRVAALDLDCWKDQKLSPTRIFEWIDALIEAGTGTLLAAFDELDPELWILALRWMAEFSIPGQGDGGAETGPWDETDSAAADATTDDGVVFYNAESPDHEDRIRAILDAARTYAPSLYWDFVQGAIHEPVRSCEETAARWHQGRLSDLGFPDLERAMAVYRPLDPRAVPVVASLSAPPAEASAVQPALSGSWLERALAELPAGRVAEIQGDFYGLANALVVADRLPLTDAPALEHCVRKALSGVDRGLESLATIQFRTLGEIVDTTPIQHLFRLGVGSDPTLRPKKTLAQLDAIEDAEIGFDWDVLEEILAEADQTLRPDGTLRR